MLAPWPQKAGVRGAHGRACTRRHPSINDLFAIERHIVDASPERRLGVRKEQAAPIVRQLFEWRDDLLAHGHLRRSMLAGVRRYLRNTESRLKRFLENGRIPSHNNLPELQARHLAVGRKNGLLFNSFKFGQGAEAGCIWLSLVLSARMHKLDVKRYPRDLFRILPPVACPSCGLSIECLSSLPTAETPHIRNLTLSRCVKSSVPSRFLRVSFFPPLD